MGIVIYLEGIEDIEYIDSAEKHLPVFAFVISSAIEFAALETVFDSKVLERFFPGIEPG